MGMFDYVRCDAPLPDDKPSPADFFQTKDFPSPYMDHYTITAAGRLIAHRTTYDFEKDDAAPMGLWLRRRPLGDEDLNWHGWLNFYGGEKDEWREFNAKFTDGQLIEIISVGEPREAGRLGGDLAARPDVRRR